VDDLPVWGLVGLSVIANDSPRPVHYLYTHHSLTFEYHEGRVWLRDWLNGGFLVNYPFRFCFWFWFGFRFGFGFGISLVWRLPNFWDYFSEPGGRVSDQYQYWWSQDDNDQLYL
jgi:hypothetical protein